MSSLIDRNTQVVAFQPRMTLAQFQAILEAAGSPAAPEAPRAYSAIVTQGLSPAFILAIFKHESNYGLEGFGAVNKSPGNTRSSMTGMGISVQTVKGPFIRYPNWFEGFRDLAWRIVKPDYVYAQEGRRTIEQIITRFAPVEDGNDPEAYISSVVKLMNSWIGGSSDMVIPSSNDIGFPVRVHGAADVGPDRPLSQVVQFIVHDTEGGMGGDEYVLTSADAPVESSHALIAPDGTTVILIPPTQTAWTPGNDFVAQRSINVEMSGFQSKGYSDAQYRAMANYFVWCVGQGCPIPAVYVGRTGKPGIIGHQDVPNPFQAGAWGGASGHTDPGPLFDWDKFIGYIKDKGVNHVSDNQGPKPAANVIQLNGFTLGHGFKDYFEANGGIKIFGLPLSNEQTNPRTGLTEQCFERIVLEYDPSATPDWKVRGKDIGRFYLTNRGF